MIYPAFAPQVPGEAAEQTLRMLIDELVVRRDPYQSIFTTRRTFLSPALGALYRVPVDRTQDWTPYEFPAGSPRAGILTSVGFLSLYSHAGRSSPTRRGRAIREVFLCEKVPDPPPNVDFSIIEDPHARFSTARERLAAHASDPTCAGCHKMTDPMGLTLEKFDGSGQFRSTEGTAPIDPSGELDGVKFADAAGLGSAMAGNPSTSSCLTNRLYSYAVGRETGKGDRPTLKALRTTFANDHYRLPDLMRAIALHPTFRKVSRADAAPQPQRTAMLEVHPRKDVR